MTDDKQTTHVVFAMSPIPMATLSALALSEHPFWKDSENHDIRDP